jgi:hypothetical protein
VGKPGGEHSYDQGVSGVIELKMDLQ